MLTGTLLLLRARTRPASSAPRRRCARRSPTPPGAPAGSCPRSAPTPRVTAGVADAFARRRPRLRARPAAAAVRHRLRQHRSPRSRRADRRRPSRGLGVPQRRGRGTVRLARRHRHRRRHGHRSSRSPRRGSASPRDDPHRRGDCGSVVRSAPRRCSPSSATRRRPLRTPTSANSDTTGQRVALLSERSLLIWCCPAVSFECVRCSWRTRAGADGASRAPART